MQVSDKTYTPFILVPGFGYVEVVGGKCEVIDGKQYLRIICEDSEGNEIALNPSDLQVYFDRCCSPF